jgi:hypothetical protein
VVLEDDIGLDWRRMSRGRGAFRPFAFSPLLAHSVVLVGGSTAGSQDSDLGSALVVSWGFGGLREIDYLVA